MLLVTALLLAAAPPELALLCSSGQDAFTELRFQPVGATTLAPAAARLEHLAGESVQGTLLPGRRGVVAVAPAVPTRDLSFASHLFLLEAGRPTRDLADRVQHGARALVTSTGRVFVARGEPGRAAFDPRATLRVDALSLDEVDLRSGATRTVFAFSGYALFPVGEWRGALLLYRVGPEGGALFTVHPDALGVTALAELSPTARDFQLDARAGAVLFTRAAGEAWEVAQLDLASRALRVLAQGPSMALLPTPLPDGRVAVARGAGRGLFDAAGAEPAFPAQGQGFDRVRALGRGGALAVGLNERPDGSAAPFAVELASGRSLQVAAPAGQRLDLAGLVQP